MSSPGAMGAIGEVEEDPSPSLSLLQRLKKLREWQERQRQELLQTQSYTPSRPYLPPLAEETPSSFESTITEDSTSTPVAAPQRAEDFYEPTGLPGAGSSSSLSPLTSDLQDGTSSNFESTGIEDSVSPTPPMAVPQGCHTLERSSGIGSASPVVPVASDIVKPHVSLPEEADAMVQKEDARGYHTSSGFSGSGSSSPVVPVASYILVKRPVGFSEEVNARPQEEDAREKLPIHSNNDTRKAAGSVREREDGNNERQRPPLTSQGPSMVAAFSHLHQNNPETYDERNDVNVRETESEYGPNQIIGTQEETHYSLPSASLSPHDEPNECMDESMEDLLGGERRVQYSSEKYKSSAPSKGLRVPESSQAAKNLISSRPFFSGLIQGSEEGLKVVEETPRPRQRFLKKGEGTARFRMRPMRLRKPRMSEEDGDCGWQGNEDVPQMPSPAATPVRSQFRVPVHSLQLQGTPRCSSGPVLVPTQQCILPARPQAPAHLAAHSARHPVPNQQPIHPARPPGPTQPPYHSARPPAPTQQPSHTTFRPPTYPTTHNPARHPASTLQPTQSATLPSVPNPARHPSSTLQLTQTTTNPTRPPPNPYRDLEKQQRKEAAELSAFEKLEELAEDSSFSSNSSTVVGLLRQGQHSISSTPMRTPPPLALQETPVVGSCNTQPKNLESQFLGDMMNRVLLSAPQHQQAAPLDMKEVLAQLKAIVRLEGHSVSDITESDIQTFLDGCSSDNIQPFDAPHLTSTPASPQPNQPPQTRPHHVHFATEGVQVMEYQLSDTEGEDTLTDATSLDSDMMTTSDLEALTHLRVREVKPDGQVQSRRENSSPDTSCSGDATLTEQEPPQGAHPVVLSFSPPPPRPPQSASHYIWSIFGKDRDGKKASAPQPAPKKATKEAPHPPPPRPLQEKTRNAPIVSQTGPGVDTSQEELEVHKTLLLAKVAELEKETKLFKKDNAKLQALQTEVKEEKKKLEEEKQRIQEEAKTERKRFQEYVDRERNALWNERQKVLNPPPPPAPQPQEHLMEVIRLREQVREMKEEAQRKESLNQFTAKKLNDRIKALESENKRLQARNKSLENLEKENQDLRLKLDRAKASGRMRPGTQPTQPTKATRGRPKTGTRPTTVDGVAKTLDRLTKPQPMIIKEAETKTTRTKQDLVNNNLGAGAMETEEAVLRQVGSIEIEEAVLKQGGSTKTPLLHSDQDMPDEEAPPSTSTDGLRHIEGQVPLLHITEEAGLEHTERVREDGVREVIYANGNRKEIHPSGDVTVSFYNGDRKEVKADRTVYVYGSDQTSHTAYSDGREEFVFPSGQRETRHPDGSSEISFPDGSRKSVTSDGTEICTTKDGSIVRTNPDGSKVFQFPSGQREVHRNGEKRREYPNGTVKIVHPDGRMETRYSSGRLRIRDREGNVILDSHVSLSSPPPLHPHSSLPS